MYKLQATDAGAFQSTVSCFAFASDESHSGWVAVVMNVEGNGKWQPEWPFSKMSQGTRQALPKWWHLSLSGAFSFTMAGAEATINSSVLFWLSLLIIFSPPSFPPFLCICAFSFQFLLLCWTPISYSYLASLLFSPSVSFHLTILSFYHPWLSAAHICG